MPESEICCVDLRAGVPDPIALNLGADVIALTPAPDDAIDLEVNASPINLALQAEIIQLGLSGTVQGPKGDQGPAGPSGSGGDVRESLISILWNTPSAESAQAIEIVGGLLDYQNNPFNSSIADIEIVVTDGAADNEPSHTATITAAASPVGQILAGSDTATIVIRSDDGSIAIAIREATPNCKRYLWIRGAGHERLWVRAANGVQELDFS